MVRIRTTIPDQEKVLTEMFDLPELPPGIAAPPILLPFDFQFEMVDEYHRIDTMFLINGEYVIGFSTNMNKDDANVTLSVSVILFMLKQVSHCRFRLTYVIQMRK